MDPASPSSAGLTAPANRSGDGEPGTGHNADQSVALRLAELSGVVIDDLWRESEAEPVGLRKDELAGALLTIGARCNYGFEPGVTATPDQVGAFWRSLHLRDLALAQACSLGRDAAWQQFMAQFREPLRQMGAAMTWSAARGQELADSLHAEMFGLTEHEGHRRSPLDYYSGRGSLKGFLRATLAQRNVDMHRRSSRETSLTVEGPAASRPASVPKADVLSRLGKSLAVTLGSLTAEERFLLSAWFLDRRTLLEISRVVRVHEATVSRRIQRLTSRLHQELLRNLEASGLSRAAAEEALGTDPRDVEINLRSVLQSSQPSAFLRQGPSAKPDPS